MCENKEILVVFLPFSRLKKEGLKEPQNYKLKLFLCPPQKQAKTQPTFENCIKPSIYI